MLTTLTTYGTWFPYYTRLVKCPKGLSPSELAESEALAMAAQLDASTDLKDKPGTITAIVGDAAEVTITLLPDSFTLSV